MESAELMGVEQEYVQADPVVTELERIVSPEDKSLSR